MTETCSYCQVPREVEEKPVCYLYLILVDGYVVVTAHSYKDMMVDWEKEKKYRNKSDVVSVVKLKLTGELEQIENYMSTSSSRITGMRQSL